MWVPLSVVENIKLGKIVQNEKYFIPNILSIANTDQEESMHLFIDHK